MSTNPSPIFTGRPYQLTTGEWGVLLAPQTQGLRPPQQGDVVQITSKAGKSWPAHLDRHIPREDGQLVFTVQTGAPAPPTAAQEPPPLSAPPSPGPQQAPAQPPAGLLYCPHCFRPILFLPG